MGRFLGEGYGKMLCFVLAQPEEVEGRSGGWEEGLCDGWSKEMREFICIQMVSITFRSHFRFEAQVATPGVWTFLSLGDPFSFVITEP